MTNESANDICAECGIRREDHSTLVPSDEHLFTTRVGKEEPRQEEFVEEPPRSLHEALLGSIAHRADEGPISLGSGITYAGLRRAGLLTDNSGPNLPDMFTYDEIAIWDRIQEQIPKNRLMKLGGHVVPRDHPFAGMSRLVVLESLGPDNPLYYRARIELRDLYVVWSVKVLQNWKTLVSTDMIAGIYFEVTYNGDTGEAYVDEYRKSRNTVVKIADGKPASV